MSRLTTQLTVTVGGLRGPGLSTADAASIEAAKTEATRAAGFQTLAAATAFAPKLTTGQRTSVTGAGAATHAAVAGEVALGGAAATPGSQIIDNGVYEKQASGALWRVADLESQKAAASAASLGSFSRDATIRARAYTDSILKSDNLYRQDEIVPGYWVSTTNGAIVVATGSANSGYIRVPVTPGLSYVTNIPRFNDNGTRFVFRDVDMNPLLPTFVQTVGTAFVAPANAVWLDASLPPVNSPVYDRSKIFLGEGTAVPAAFTQRKKVVDAATDVLAAAGLITLPGTNLAPYSEDLTQNPYNISGLTRGAADFQIRLPNKQRITMNKITASGFYHSLRMNYAGYALAPFTVGKLYFVSAYVLGMPYDEPEWFFYMKLPANANNAPEAKMMTHGLRRVWTMGVAVTTTKLAFIDDPTVDLRTITTATTPGSDPYLFVEGQSYSGGASYPIQLYMGGVQVEQAPDNIQRGVAVIGDSTMQVDAALNDTMANSAPGRYFAAQRNIPVFIRAIGGQRTDQMDARWATDMTPLKANCKYALNQGGINDIAQNRTLADIQASMTSMANKAVADGFIPVLATCTPLAVADANIQAKEDIRQALNKWIKQNFARVVDLDAVICDPLNPRYINPLYAPADQSPHYNRKGCRAAGLALHQADFWDIPEPSPYLARLAA